MTDAQLRQAAVEVLGKELRAKRVSRARSEIALAVLTELRETAEDLQEPKQDWQDFVKEEYARTAIQLELEKRLLPRGSE